MEENLSPVYLDCEIIFWLCMLAGNSQLNSDHSYNLAYYATCINRPQEDIDVLQTVDPEKGWLKDWVPYWWSLTLAHHMLGDHKQELKEARRGRKQHPEKFETFLNEVQAQAALGKIKEVNRLIEESFSLVPEEYLSPGRIMLAAGAELRQHKNKAESLRDYPPFQDLIKPKG